MTTTKLPMQGLTALACLAVDHENKAAKIEREHMNTECKFTDNASEAMHNYHRTVARELDSIACRREDYCAFYLAIKGTYNNAM
jgi:hypothetical protein